jgi:hypothetical protein
MGSWKRLGPENAMRDLRVLTRERVGDLTGPCAPCSFWLTVPHNGHVPEPDPLELLGDWVDQVTREWGPPGRVLYIDDVPSGYALLAPARYVPRLAAFPTAPSDGSTLMLLTACAETSDKSRGLRKTLLQAAAKDALRHKARAVSAIGARPVVANRHPCVLGVDVLESAGFRVEREHPLYPRLRLDLRTVLSVKDEATAMVARALARIPGARPVAEAPHPDGATRARTTD